jgi:hypothetical protein
MPSGPHASGTGLSLPFHTIMRQYVGVHQVFIWVVCQVHIVKQLLVSRTAASMCSIWWRALGWLAPSVQDELFPTQTKTCSTGFRKSAVLLGGSIINKCSNSVIGRPSLPQKSHMTIS